VLRVLSESASQRQSRNEREQVHHVAVVAGRRLIARRHLPIQGLPVGVKLAVRARQLFLSRTNVRSSACAVGPVNRFRSCHTASIKPAAGSSR
jgi:hypothetical protein